MAYTSIFKDKKKTQTTRSGGYVSIFTKEKTNKEKREEQAKKITQELVDSGQATTTPLTSLPQREKPEFFSPSPDKVRIRDVAREAGSLLLSPFKKLAKGIKEDYQERRDKTSEQKEEELATRALAGLEGSVYQKKEAEKLKQGISKTSREKAFEMIKGQEEQTEKLSKILTVPVRYTAGSLASGLVSYSMEKVDSDLVYDPRSDAEKLLINEGRVQRITKQEDLYGMVARGVGIPAALVTMVLIENPFLKSTGVGAVIKQSIKRKAEKEAGEAVIKIGAEELSKIADDVINNELKVGKITKKEAIKATEEVSKMKKKVTPLKTKEVKSKKAPIKYIPEEKPVDLRKKVTTESLIGEPSIPKRLENQAIEKGLVKNFKNIDDYDKVSFKDQAKKVGEIIDEDPYKAIKIALGEEIPTNGALPESVFIAVKNQALKKGDTDLLIQLATAEKGVARESTILGQRIKMLDEGVEDDAFRKINRLVKERKKKFEVKDKKVSKAKETEVNKIKDNIKKPDKYDWNDFIKKIEC